MTGFMEEVRAGFISASASILLGGLANFAVAEIGKIWNVDSELRKLERAVSRIMVMIDHVEAGQWSCFSSDNSKRAWKLWLEDVKTLSNEAEDLLEEISAEIDHLKQSKVAKVEADDSASTTLPKIISEQQPVRKEILSSVKLDVPHEISKLSQELEQLAGEMDKLLTFQSKFDRTTRVVPSSSSIAFSDEYLIGGRDVEKADILGKLLSDSCRSNEQLSVISIVGMGGIGKTTLAKLVYNDEKVFKSFHLRLWASVSLDFDVVRITRSMIESITNKSCKLMDLHTLQAKLEELLRGKRFLVVLDDAWSENYNDWEVLFLPFRCDSTGGKVIITTRSRVVSGVVGSDPFMLSLLDNNSCWEIMKRRALVNINIGADENIDALGLEIAKKCKGLPLVAKIFGSTINRIPFEEWDAILRSDLWDTQCKDGIFRALSLSYHFLPTHLKKCFAYCALFPANHKFEEDNLVLLWMAEGFIQPMGERRLECIGRQYFKDLVWRSFFYSDPVEKKIYRMHDFCHEMAQFISTDICLQMESERLAYYPSLKNIRRLSFCCNNLLSVESMKKFPDCKRLRTFLLSCSNADAGVGQGTSYLLRKFSMLRVLDLSRGNLMKLPELIIDLKHLRYLNVSRNPLQCIPDSIDQLLYLQTLKVNSCEDLRFLPKCLRNMGNLRHLQFDQCLLIKQMPLGFGELINLQSLSTFVVSQGEGHTIAELKEMACLRGTLHLFRCENVNEDQAHEANLQMKPWLDEIELEWTAPSTNHDAEIVLIHIPFHENLKKLVITSYYGETFPQNWLRHSGSKLKSIHLRGCKKCTLLPVLGHLQHLESLCIEGMPALEKVFAVFFKGFPSLKSFEFRGMPELKEWENLTGATPLGAGCMPALQVLICENCPKLVTFPSLNILASLTILKIRGCPKLEELLPERMPLSLQELDVDT